MAVRGKQNEALGFEKRMNEKTHYGHRSCKGQQTKVSHPSTRVPFVQGR